MTEAHHEEEWRKRLTASLSEAPTFVMLDNIRQKLDSAALAAVLTTQTWTDRILGRSEVITLPVKCVWLASGNNPMLTTEMARRTIRIRLDSTHARPWQRTGFKHENLRKWVLSNREKVLWCLLTLVQSWIAAGQPQAGQTLGNYEQWAEVIGGILGNAGFKGFLGNLDEMYDSADEEAREWEDFVTIWWDAHRMTSVGVAIYSTSLMNMISCYHSGEQGTKIVKKPGWDDRFRKMLAGNLALSLLRGVQNGVRAPRPCIS